MPTWGKIFQNFDLKYTFVTVMSIFTLGSLICALSPNSIIFIIARAIAGLGAGGMFAGGLTIIAYSVPMHRRAAYTGALGGVFGVRTFLRPS
jgi:predicted MFS family arabinose efflux permease